MNNIAPAITPVSKPNNRPPSAATAAINVMYKVVLDPHLRVSRAHKSDLPSGQGRLIRRLPARRFAQAYVEGHTAEQFAGASGKVGREFRRQRHKSVASIRYQMDSAWKIAPANSAMKAPRQGTNVNIADGWRRSVWMVFDELRAEPGAGVVSGAILFQARCYQRGDLGDEFLGYVGAKSFARAGGDHVQRCRRLHRDYGPRRA